MKIEPVNEQLKSIKNTKMEFEILKKGVLSVQ